MFSTCSQDVLMISLGYYGGAGGPGGSCRSVAAFSIPFGGGLEVLSQYASIFSSRRGTIYKFYSSLMICDLIVFSN